MTDAGGSGDQRQRDGSSGSDSPPAFAPARKPFWRRFGEFFAACAILFLFIPWFILAWALENEKSRHLQGKSG